MSRTKEQDREASRIHYENNKKKVIARNQAYYLKNRERLKELGRIRWHKNRLRDEQALLFKEANVIKISFKPGKPILTGMFGA